MLARPRFARRYGVTERDIAVLVALLGEQAEVVGITGSVQLCRDPDDDMVIETARNGRADVLVTRDDDLKVDWDLVQLLLTEGIQVLSVTRFLAALAEESGVQ